jgi:hypothetical protein
MTSASHGALVIVAGNGLASFISGVITALSLIARAAVPTPTRRVRRAPGKRVAPGIVRTAATGAPTARA